MQTFTISVLLITLLSAGANASKILFLVAFPGHSHWLMFEHIIRELLVRGHDVTAVTNYPLKGNYTNYHEYMIEPKFDFEDGLPMITYFEENIASDPFRAIDILWFLGLETSKHAMNCRRVQDLIHDRDLKFDLVIAEQFYQESFLMFAHKYKAPLITLSTLSYSDFMDRAFGQLTPWSFVPHFILEFSDDMDLTERIYNVVLSMYDLAMRRFNYLPGQNEVAQMAFAGLADLKPLPTVQELETSIDLMLVNHHHVFSRPRPKLPGMVDIAGVHIREPKPLPQNIQAFIDKYAEQGVIFFSLGSYLRASAMPAAKLKIFLDTFAKLPYGIIWKWEADSIPGLPANVLIQKWLPQNDILANPNVKLFMTHGGLFGTQEAVYRAQPMVFFPCYGDQYRNSFKLMRAGLGRVLNLVNLTAADLERTVLEVATNPKYKRNVERMSTMFRDNQAPLTTISLVHKN